MTTQNLWGALPDVQNVRTPVQILREQATLLREMTKGVLEGRVEPGESSDDRQAWSLYIIAPALKNYRFRILSIWHPITLYPVTFSNVDGVPMAAMNEEAFVAVLERVLKADRVRNVITALLAQSQE